MDILLARQPIFDKSMILYGYELLYRSSSQSNSYDCKDGDRASSSVISSSFINIGINNLTSGKKAFINFTENLINEKVALLFPKKFLVVEVLETVRITESIKKSLADFKKAGYSIALDDFVFSPVYDSLIGLADYIKIDFLNSEDSYIKGIVLKYSDRAIKFLAEKVESKEMFNKAVEYGYTLFQGYFFSKPSLVSTNSIKPYKINYLNIVELMNENNIDFVKISDIIERDVAFSYEILKLVNTIHYYRGNRINSIKQALAIMGEIEIKKWVYLAIIRKLATDGQEELVNISMMRSKCLEELAVLLNQRSKMSDYLLLGMFSLIDALLNKPMEEVTKNLPLPAEVRDVLLGKAEKGKLYLCYNLVKAYEIADWDAVGRYSDFVGIDSMTMSDIYNKAIDWVNQLNEF